LPPQTLRFTTAGLLGAIVGRGNRGIDQEPEPVHGVLQKMTSQAAIGVVGEAAGGPFLQFATQGQPGLRQRLRIDSMAAPRTAQGERFIDQLQHGAGKAHSTSASRVRQIPTATLQVAQALLMKP